MPVREQVSSSRLTVLAEGALGIESAKTASSVVRYQPERVSSIIDSSHAGRTAQSVLGFGGDIPVVGTLREALGSAPLGSEALDLGPIGLGPPPEALLIGIAPQGGGLPEEWRPVLVEAIEAGLGVISGLHLFLSEDRELSDLAGRRNVSLIDLRKPPDNLAVGRGLAMRSEALRVLTVGMDCNAGKMTASLELLGELEALGLRTGFGATGQSGILIAGSGIAVDAVPADFISGAAERLTLEAAEGKDVVLVEGQGTLMHPGFSGVTLGLLHGSAPQAMILSWLPSRERIYGGNHDWVALPELDEAVRRYEDALAWICPAVAGKVIGVAVATYALSEGEARAAVARAGEVTGLPATDPVRFGAGPLARAIERRWEEHRHGAG